MKFIVNSKKLASATSIISRAIASKSSISILSTFFFSLDDGKLSITGSDMENCLSTSISLDVFEGEGSFCIEAKRIVDILKLLPDEGITFDVKGNTAKMVCGNGKYSISCLDATTYPSFNVPNDDVIEIECRTSMIAEALNATSFAIGHDDLWPAMHGVYFCFNNNQFDFVGTDSSKLAKYSVAHVSESPDFNFILPEKAIALTKSIMYDSEMCKMKTNGKSAEFLTDNYTLRVTLIKAKFPDFNRAIPKDLQFSVEIDRAQLLGAAKRLDLFNDNRVICMKFDVNGLTLMSKDSTTLSQAEEVVKCDWQTDEFMIGHNNENLIAVLSNMPGETVILKMNSPATPMIIEAPEASDRPSLLTLLAPMTLNNF